jgi:hypothetical protein
VDFQKFNVATKNSYPLPFNEELWDMVANYKVYCFLDYFFNYHQIMTTPKDKYKIAFIINWGVFVLLVMPFALKNVPPTYQWVVSLTFWEHFNMFMNLFVDDFNAFSDWKTHLDKVCLCLQKCWECGISLHPKKCMFIVYSRIILE